MPGLHGSTTVVLAFLIACLNSTSPLVGQELFADFESGSLGGWSVKSDHIAVTGLSTWTAHPDQYRWLYFGVGEIKDEQPEFRVPASAFLGSLVDHRFVWSYDQQDWSFFDSHRFQGLDYAFTNDTPFAQDEVYVAYSTPYPVARTSQFVAELSREWFVFPTASGSRDLTVGSLAGLPLYGFRLTNPLITSPKTKVVLVSGNHSGEMGGSFALEGLVEFLSSDDERAKQMRNVADFYIYPLVDPLGRAEGYYRGNSQNPANDHNRFWDALSTGDNGGFAELDVLAEAMRVDTAADVDFTFDFHGFFSPGADFIYTDTPGTRTAFFNALLELEPALAIEVDDGTAPTGILEFWAKTAAGLGSDFAFTPEFSSSKLAAEWKQSGVNYGLALYSHLGEPSLARSSDEIDVLSAALRSGSAEVAFDLDRDGVTSWQDHEFMVRQVLGLVPGDTDLNGQVEFADFLTLSGHYGEMAGWSGGDFDGNGVADFADFLQISANFRGNAALPVPEPCCPFGWFVLATIRIVRYHTGFTKSRNRFY